MRSFPILMVLLFTSLSLTAQQNAGPSFTFNSEEEKEAFIHFNADSFESRFSLLFYISPGAENAQQFAKRLTYFIEDLRPQVERIKKPHKKIKKIHREVHANFLKKYVLHNYFPDIFLTGEYNCVSATALYGLVLEELGIPVSFQETPNHVFLIAYPDTHQIALESTDPQVGYMTFDERFKSQYVSQLRRMKLISEEEFQSKSLNTLFDEVYFNNPNISFQELIALQYYNDGYYKLEKKEYAKSLQQFEKAYHLYPSERIGQLSQIAALSGLDNKTYDDSLFIDFLSSYGNMARFKGAGKVEDANAMVLSYFGRFMLDQLSRTSQAAYYDRMFQKLSNQLHDSLLVKDIAHIYYYEKSRSAYNRGEISLALENIEQAYSLFPNDTDNLGLLLNCLGQKLNSISSVDEKASFLEKFVHNYPALQQNNLIYSQLLNIYLIQFGQAFELEDAQKGRQIMELFEKAYEQKLSNGDDYLVDANLIGRSYSVAAVYYFRKGQTTRARQLIDRGLQYAPGSGELMQRKRMIR